MELVSHFRFEEDQQELDRLRAIVGQYSGTPRCVEFRETWAGWDDLQRLECSKSVNTELAKGSLLIYTNNEGGYLFFDAHEDPERIELELEYRSPMDQTILFEQIFEVLFSIDDDRDPTEY